MDVNNLKQMPLGGMDSQVHLPLNIGVFWCALVSENAPMSNKLYPSMTSTLFHDICHLNVSLNYEI